MRWLSGAPRRPERKEALIAHWSRSLHSWDDARLQALPDYCGVVRRTRVTATGAGPGIMPDMVWTSGAEALLNVAGRKGS